MNRYSQLHGQYHFKPLILKLKYLGKTNDEIGDLLDISKSTVKYIVKNGELKTINNKINDLIGCNDKEFLRVAAVYSCMEIFSNRGWQTGISDNKCVYDIFCLKNNKCIKIQVRSSGVFSSRNYPVFKTARILFNTKRTKRTNFVTGNFDYWYFYSVDGRKWLIPFDKMTNRSTVSMEGFDEYKV